MGKPTRPFELLPGTLDLLILKALAGARIPGYGIAQTLKEASEDVLEVGESSLYLHCNVSCSMAGSPQNGVPPRTTAAHAIMTSPPPSANNWPPNVLIFERMVTAIQRVLQTA
jgi:hypothetical protein